MKKLSLVAICLMLVLTSLGNQPAQAQTFSCSATTIPEQECQALELLYISTNGEAWFNNENWLISDDPGTWFGVLVQEGHVTGLWLYGNNLTGTLPTETSNLSYLETLSLSSNNITGEIPSSLGNVTSLINLELHDNQLYGEIPITLGNLSQLRVLSLSGNGFSDNGLSGTIPSELGNLTNLETLRLGWNELTGEIPTSLGNLTSLITLGLGGNQLIGEIPATLGNLSQLRYLDLGDNDWPNGGLSGAIPPELGNLTNLETLNLRGNSLTGNVPLELANLLQLVYLGLDWNELEGNIPIFLGNFKNLTTLSLGFNKFGGQIPLEMMNLTNLTWLDLASNFLDGSLPQEIGNLANLNNLKLSGNRFSGDIPFSITNLVNLCTPESEANYDCWGDYGLDLGGNRLNTTGYDQTLVDFLDVKDPDWAETQLAPFTSCEAMTAIPTEECFALEKFYQYTGGDNWNRKDNWFEIDDPMHWYGLMAYDGHVRGMLLSNNNLSGTLPPELAQLSQISHLMLSGNALSGSIPLEMGSLSNMVWLLMADNEFTGTLPSELGNLSNLEILSLYQNQLNGPIPISLNQLSNLRKLSLGANQLSGEIPVGLSSLSNLRELDLSENDLTGNLPSELSPYLASLNLSNNQFVGLIPETLGDFTNLQSLKLSANQLEGSIPSTLGNLTKLTQLRVDQNDLSGDIPDSLINLINLCTPDIVEDYCAGDYGLDLGYNSLNILASESLMSFLNIKDPDWTFTQVQTKTIQPDNGETIITSEDDSIDIVIPDGTLENETTFQLEPQPEPTQDTGGFIFAGTSFQLTAEDTLTGETLTTFDPPLILKVYYDEANLGESLEEDLRLFYWDELQSQWADVISTCDNGVYTRDLENNWLSVTVCHFSEFALMAQNIQVIGEAPQITSRKNATINPVSPKAFLIEATGYPLPNISLIGELPKGVTFTDNGNGTATLSGTPEVGVDGTFELVITASNLLGYDSQTLTLRCPPLGKKP